MLKNPLLFVLFNFFFHFFIFSQKDTSNHFDIKLENNFNLSLSNNKTNSFGLFYSGINTLKKQNFSFDLVTNYNNRFNPNLSENELSQRSTIEMDKIKWNNFITHQYTYSLSREIKSENWIGVGLGMKKKTDFGQFSISYAIIYQNSDFFEVSSQYIWRNSLRVKYRIENKNFNIYIEYFYQPGLLKPNDCIIYGTTKIGLFLDKKVSLVLQDNINFRNYSSLKLIHNFNLGIGWKVSKNISKK